MIRNLVFTTLALLTPAANVAPAATMITVVNPGGESYGPIEPGGAPLSVTGWNSTQAYNPLSAVEAISNTARSGARRLSVGAVTGADGSAVSLPDDVVLYQTLDHVVAEGEKFELNFYGRGFFQFTNVVDFQSSFFGYEDDGGTPVKSNVKQHAIVVGGAWNLASHLYEVHTGSPMIGKPLVIGFYNSSGDFSPGAPNTGAFSSIDDVSLTLVPEPATALIASTLFGGIASCASPRRRAS